MGKETYAQAQKRILQGLEDLGWAVMPYLKVPQAWQGTTKLFFRKQAVYLDDHSMFIDIRGMSVDTFLVKVNSYVD